MSGGWIAFWIFGWWLSAFVPLILMSDSGWRDITWKDLLIISCVSLMGLVIGFIIVGTVLESMDFWNQPIFGRRKDDD